MTSKRRASAVHSSELSPREPMAIAVRRALRTRRYAVSACAGVFAAGLAGALAAVRPAAVFPAVFELSSLLPNGGGDGSTGFVLTGIDARDESGVSVSAAGDVNGDGADDLVVGAFGAAPGGRSYTGESYVVFGRDTGQVGNFPAVFPLASLLGGGGGDGSAGFVLRGIDASDLSGFSVSAAGDVNGDGIDDLIVGAREADPGGRSHAGETYVVFGRDTAQIGNFPAVFPLASLLPGGGGDGSRGFVLAGIDRSDYSGRSVSAAEDVNGDGIDDLIVGASGASHGGRFGAGESYVVFGRDAAQVGNFPAVFPLESLPPGDGSAGFVLSGIDSFDYSGSSLSAAGDVNGDGISDLVIGGYFADPGGRTNAGEIYVVFGRDTGQVGNFPAVFPLASLLPRGGGDGSTGFVLTGIDEYDHSGYSVSAAGDVNGDGIGDLIVGATGPTSGGGFYVGETYVVFGRDTAQVGDFAAVFPLVSLLPGGGGDGSAGFVLMGIDSHDRSGCSVSAVGDVNGDGTDDLIVGASGDGVYSTEGESYVVFGRDTAQVGNFPAVFPLVSLLPDGGGDGSAGFVLKGIDRNDSSGRSVSAAGDVNGDGIDDVVIGAPSADPGGKDLAGETYVVFGRSAAPAP